MRQRLGILFLAMCLTGCAAGGAYRVHPGSAGYTTGTPTQVQIFTSQSYDTLVGADAVIMQTRADFLANKFPPSSMPTIKAAFNALVLAYNTAQASWISFNESAAANPSTPQAALAATLAGVASAITSLNAAKGGN